MCWYCATRDNEKEDGSREGYLIDRGVRKTVGRESCIFDKDDYVYPAGEQVRMNEKIKYNISRQDHCTECGVLLDIHESIPHSDRTYAH